MSRTLTFIHAADLHIGAPFRGLRALSPAWADLMLEAIPQAYGRVIDVACERGVDFVVFPGDIFDEAQASYADYRCFFEGIERLGDHGIPAYLCTGNHDPYVSWQQNFYALPENARMFAADRPDFALYERDGEPLCVLGGRGFLNSVWPRDESIAQGITREAANRALGDRAHEAPFGVGVLHSGLDLDHVKAPASRSELLAAGFDYWALGHIHRRWTDDESNPRLCFSGDIQGRDIKERGRRGVNLVTLSEHAPNRVEFIPTATVAWERIDVSAQGCANIPTLVREIMDQQYRANGGTLCDKMISRVTLRGATSLHGLLRQPGVLEDVRAEANKSHGDFFIDALIDKTTAPRDRDALRAEGLFPAALMAEAERLRAVEEEDLSAFLQEEIISKKVSINAPATFADLGDLVEEAEDLVLDLLLEGEQA